ncbi:efflux RND transporter periplasmic adaptor subunit [Permianibacter sp. IMCC34836]|uniref:efflux RND transporter periplasmic adaptor subunit n=1 Tax=Permianibacter fluminis TaxID=2738515 RepID=UPI001555E65A|nr:efflux RND transporter periplasmic adaptor subunit [Permianibacter fluminis]NQD36952.1 efflux RND transporter periplasmic adaptor subunit [Permianibacter fluminis]
MSTDLNQLKIDRSGLTVSSRSPWPKRLIWLAAIAVTVVVIMVLGGNRPANVSTTSVVNVWPSQPITVLNATGYVAAQRKAAVASKGTGRLEWLGVREGSVVKQGEVIARLENSDVKAQVEQAQANAAVARSQLQEAEAELRNTELAFKRAKELIAQKLISTSDYDLADARYAQAKAAVAARRSAIQAAEANVRVTQVALENTSIRAPFDGVVLTKNANVGDVLSPFNTGLDSKGAVVSMADMNTLEVEADVSEASLGKVKLGQACEIQLDGLPEVRLLGEVASMVPSVDRSKATVMFKIRFVETDARVLPDMSAKVAFLERTLAADERKPRMGVNPQAIRSVDNRKEVLRVRDGKLEVIAVTVASMLGDAQIISGDLTIGDKLVLNPAPELKAGAAVTVAE